MFRMLGNKVELYRYKIIYTEDEVEMQENCISLEHKNEIEQKLTGKEIIFTTTQIDQTNNEWMDGVKFDSYDEALIVFNSGLPKPKTEIEKLQEVSEIIDKKLEANLNATRKLVKQSTLTDEKLIEFVNIYPSREIGKVLEIDDVLKYNDELYRVIQSHTTQSDWTPNISQSLFTKIQPANVIPIWVQPTGSHDAYDIDDKVEFEGSVYESTIDANTYSPTAYPAGWNVV